jgi:hypothetical protein
LKYATYALRTRLVLLLMEDEQMIEALTSHTAKEAFIDGIRPRGVIRSFENLDVTRLRHPSEAHAKFAVVITDEVLRSHTKGGSEPSLLCSPGSSGIACHADVDHSARVQFDDEEDEQRAEEEVSDRKKIAGPDLREPGVCKKVFLFYPPGLVVRTDLMYF